MRDKMNAFLNRLLNPELARKLEFLAYRYRFLLVYVLIGFTSLLLEFLVFRGMERSGVGTLPANGAGVVSGIFYAYWMNVRFNFKVPLAKRRRALSYFVAISLGSGILQYSLRKQLGSLGWSYEVARLTMSGSLFFVAYFFHRRFSFSDLKRVGVAIYADGVEDVRGIHQRIGGYPDFIHVDLIDDSHGASGDRDPRTYRLETIRAYWPSKEIHAHIMSRRPTRWIDAVVPHVDMVIVDLDADEDVDAVLQAIRGARRQAGLCLTMKDDLEDLRPYLAHVDLVMLLSIAVRGKSGQAFDLRALDVIRTINAWPERRRFALCVDGGVNESIIGLLSVEQVVSGSSVLKAGDPRRQIMRLQTSSSYERL